MLRGLFIGVLILSSLVPKSAAIQITQQFKNIASEKNADNSTVKFYKDKRVYKNSYCCEDHTQKLREKNDCQTHEICLKDKFNGNLDMACHTAANRAISHAYKIDVFYHFTDSSPPNINYFH